MLLLIDNFDSFTYNIVQAFEHLGKRVQIARATENFTMDKTIDRVVIGPGPGHPKNSYFSHQIIQKVVGKIPLLGICLGHQCLADFFGAEVIFATQPMHGKSSTIYHDQLGLFNNIPSPLSIIRYHSLVVNSATLPSCLKITAQTAEGEIMGLRHEKNFFESVQYHPDSIMSEYGLEYFLNFLNGDYFYE